MANLRPIPTRVVDPAWVGRVPSPAHDSMSAEERRRYVESNPDSYLTITRSPDDLKPGELWDPIRAIDLSRAGVDRLLAAGAFGPLVDDALYLYRQTLHDHEQTAIVGGLAVSDYDDGTIKIHEHVQTSRAQHLASQLAGLRVQSSPIAVAHKPSPEVRRLLAEMMAASAAIIDFVAPDGLRQQVWVVDEGPRISALQAALADTTLYLIDGHHRAAAAARLKADTADGPEASTSDPAATMLCAIYDAGVLRTEAFHRCLNGIDSVALIDRLRANFVVRESTDLDEVLARSGDELALAVGQHWYLVTMPAIETEDPLAGLDPVRLERLVLGPLFGLDSASPGSELSYRHGLADRHDLETIAVADDQAVWVMRPIAIETLLLVSEAGLVMPPKSTYFVPKVRSGVFLRPLA